MDRSEDEESDGEVRASGRPRWSRARRIAIALLLGVVVVLATAWLERRTIARGFVDRELARRGVPARYEIAQLSPWRQRLTHVSIGDPRDPDLVADWIELRTALLPWRAELLVAKAGRVRIKGRIVDGALSLGSLDRLMPPPSGKPFALPRLSVEVADAQLRLDSAAGPLEIGLSGKGLLSDGFAGTARLRAPRLALAGCALEGVAGRLQVRVREGAPSLAGPLAASRLGCGDGRVEQARIDVRAALDASLARWKGSARLAVARLAGGGGRLERLAGTVDFAGDRARTEGKVALSSGALATPDAVAASATLAGQYVLAETSAFQGKLAVAQVALAPAMRRRAAAVADTDRGTPVAPLARQLAAALDRAGRSFDGSADLELTTRADGSTLRVRSLDLLARSGARMRFGQGRGLGLALPSGAVELAGRLTLGGGGLPDATLLLSRRPGSAEWRGTGLVRPYAAGGASLELARLDVRARGTSGELRTVATLSGPLQGGRVEGLSMPLLARWQAGGIAVNPACAPLGFARIAVAGMTLDGNRLQLCPLGGAMLQWRPQGLAGGVRTGPVALSGKLGDSPLQFRAAAARLDLAASRFGVDKAAVRIGAERSTRLDIGQLSGSYRSSLGGSFEGLGGQIGAVPLVLSGGKGDWRADQGDLSLLGGFILSDAESPARFEPLSAPQARLRMSGGRIEAEANLVGTKRPVAVGTVRVTHDLAKSEGQALLDVPGVRFRIDGLQPTDLTRLTYGVIADVDGLVSGTGRFAWSGDSVTSSGRFTASDVGLAAAFGPVAGLTTTLDFTDLLNLRTAPGQRADVAEINPGVPVREGVFRYQLLDSRRVQVEGARWPFAGGELVLDPTVLDFNEAGERRLTFHVKGVDAALFLKEMAFDNLDATGTFDGTLPMVFDAQGGRIEGGELRARAGGHIAYVGEVSQRDLGFWGNMAFQALKSLDYKSLAIRMNGPLAGEIITDISFAGVSQGKGTRSNFLIRRLARLPFVFNVRITAPFRQLLDSVQSWYDPRRLIERNLPALIEEQKRAQEAARPVVQPSESAPAP